VFKLSLALPALVVVAAAVFTGAMVAAAGVSAGALTLTLAAGVLVFERAALFSPLELQAADSNDNSNSAAGNMAERRIDKRIIFFGLPSSKKSY
jgi:hypothetical protein